MKFLKLSLAASVALGAVSVVNAQPLEEAIKGVDVSGYLRYRYNDDRYTNAGFLPNDRTIDPATGNAGPAGTAPYPAKNRGSATHRWKAVADFKTPVVNNVGLALGILYNNESNNVNHGNTAPGTGSGLGSGKDGSFGVSTFYATIAPDSTATTVKVGKQRLATPVTSAGDDDRGTGILALNSDIPGLTLAAGAFDSWSIDDVHSGYNSGNNDGTSVTKPLYALAAIYSLETGAGVFGAQLWGFYIKDAVDALAFGELSYDSGAFNAALQYATAKLDNSPTSLLATLHGTALPNANGVNQRANISKGNDLFLINVGADLGKQFGIPLDAKLGYLTNFRDGTAVSLNDDTAFKYAGKIWYQNNSTGFSSSALLTRGIHGVVNSQSVDVFYAAAGYKLIDNRLRIGLEYVNGKNKWDSDTTTAGVRTTTSEKVKFQEITPTISWNHSKNLTVSAFYAYLTTKARDYRVNGVAQNTYTDASVTPNLTRNYENETRARARVEVKYSF